MYETPNVSFIQQRGVVFVRYIYSTFITDTYHHDIMEMCLYGGSA